jgi:hypothetical protein
MNSVDAVEEQTCTSIEGEAAHQEHESWMGKIGTLIGVMYAIAHLMRVITHIMLGGTHENGDQKIARKNCIVCFAGFVALSIMEGA